MSRPRFAIFAAVPRYDWRDAFAGVDLRFHEACETYAWAERRAIVLNEDDYAHGGDGCFEVRVWKEDDGWGAAYVHCSQDPVIAAARIAEHEAHLASLPGDGIPF